MLLEELLVRNLGEYVGLHLVGADDADGESVTRLLGDPLSRFRYDLPVFDPIPR